MSFGNFDSVCAEAALPFCPLVGSSTLAPEAGIQAACYSRTIQLANTTIFQGGASFVHIAALIMATIMILHVRSKFTAVGRKEICIFLYLYFILSVWSLLLDAGVVPPGSSILPYFAAIQIGLASATCLSLCVNGFIGFQVYEDGTRLSVWLMWGLSTFWFGITFLIAVLTFKNVGGLGKDNTVALYVVMYIVNALLLAIYVGMQLILVLGTLQDRWPLGHIMFGVFFFVAGQVILYTAGSHICEAAQHYLDGLFFATITNLLAVMMVYKYWDSITTEDLEFSVGVKAHNWDVKGFQSLGQDDVDKGPRKSTFYAMEGSEFSRSSLQQPKFRGSYVDSSNESSPVRGTQRRRSSYMDL